MMQIGIIKEKKVPTDMRVAITPQQARWLMDNYPIEITIQSSPTRIFSDDEYRSQGLVVADTVAHADILLGIKEVLISELISNKIYYFFSHTTKAQDRNRNLLRAIIANNNILVDYEMLKNNDGQRVLAFGYFAGMVGAHNAIWTYIKRHQLFEFKRMFEFFEYNAAHHYYKNVTIPVVKIILTGTGRVGSGAAKVLLDMGFIKVSPNDFLFKSYDVPVFSQLSSEDYMSRVSDKGFDKKEFYAYPDRYESHFNKFLTQADILINGIYWDEKAPPLFAKEDICSPDYRTMVIADITCDIAPESSIPSTLRASTIQDPVYGYDAVNNEEVEPFNQNYIDTMAIDNLPNELPRNASTSFGEQFIEHVIPEMTKSKSNMIENATVVSEGKLGKRFGYLQEYVTSKDKELI